MSARPPQVVKDVHTEHCCAKHGCCYPWQTNSCTVKSGEKPQSFMCELCSDELDEWWEWIILLNEAYDKGFEAGRWDER